MTVTVGYQTWDSANYEWDTAVAGKPVPEICGALSTWITAINGNASQTGKQVVLLRDHTSSTAANYRGFALQLPILGSATKSMYFSHISVSATTAYTRVYDDASWVDNAANGGYGGSVTTTSSEFFLSDSHTHKNTVTTFGDITIASDTTDGQEFFFVGMYLDGDVASYSDGFGIMKDFYGNWCAVSIDGSSEAGAYYDPGFDRVRLASFFSTVTGANGTSTIFAPAPIAMYTASPTLANGQTVRMGVEAKNPNLLWQATGPSIYGYSNIGGGQYMLNLTVNGPVVIYTP